MPQLKPHQILITKEGQRLQVESLIAEGGQGEGGEGEATEGEAAAEGGVGEEAASE